MAEANNQERVAPESILPWPAPPGGFERVTIPTRREKRARPLTRRQVNSLRLLYVATVGVCIWGLAFGGRLGRHITMAETLTVAIQTFFYTRQQWCQVLGLSTRAYRRKD